MVCNKCHNHAEYKVTINAMVQDTVVVKHIKDLYFCSECIDARAKPRLKELKHNKSFTLGYRCGRVIFDYIYTKEN